MNLLKKVGSLLQGITALLCRFPAEQGKWLETQQSMVRPRLAPPPSLFRVGYVRVTDPFSFASRCPIFPFSVAAFRALGLHD